MVYYKFSDSNLFKVAILIKTKDFRVPELKHHYVNPILDNHKDTNIIAIDLQYTPDGKAPVATVIKPCLDTVLTTLDRLEVDLIICADANYFKKLTNNTKPTSCLGNVVDSTYRNDEFNFKVIYTPSFSGLFVNPELQKGMNMAVNAANTYLDGSYTDVGAEVLRTCVFHHYDNMAAFKEGLDNLMQYDSLSADIETFGDGVPSAAIQHNRNVLGSIAFAWDQHNGFYFDLGQKHASYTNQTVFDINHPNRLKALALLKQFLIDFHAKGGNIKYHNATFDIKCLIRHLYMEHSTDRKGMYKGIDCLTSNFDCTQAITYLALNSTIYEGKSWLSLKLQTQEYLGDYAVDVKDIRKLKPMDNCVYNVKDVIGTWYVYNKNYPIMVRDEQLEFYETMAKPILINIISMELTGLPLDINKVYEAEDTLNKLIKESEDKLANNKHVISFTKHMKNKLAIEKTEKAKKKVYSPDDIDFSFNANSGTQKVELFFNYLKLPILGSTKSGNPETGGKTIKALKNTTEDSHTLELLNCITDIVDASKIVGTFLKAFKEFSYPDINGHYWLYGSLKFGGTLSGRLASGNPNMQNLPSGSRFSKIIKGCFVAPKGWVFAGQDYANLESRINTLLTKDENKRKPYAYGFDNHMLNAVGYWRNEFPDVDIDNAEQVNTLVKTEKGKKYRQLSKSVTFAALYGGTWRTFMINSGFPEHEAKMIDRNYHKLYKQSDDWMNKQIEEVTNKGYATLAFGVRLRAPILHSTILGTSITPKEAEREKRTVSNAVGGQSYGLLNSRLSFMLEREIRKAGYEEDIWVCNNIHDAVYVVCRSKLGIIYWLNNVMPKLGEWSDLPELYDPEIKLSGKLGLFHPSWAYEIELEPYISKQEIKETIKSASH